MSDQWPEEWVPASETIEDVTVFADDGFIYCQGENSKEFLYMPYDPKYENIC